MESNRGSESSFIQITKNTKVIGRMESNMVTGNSSKMTTLSTKGTSKMERHPPKNHNPTFISANNSPSN